jgi:outer membrane protein assembly factor BamA
MIFSRKYHLPAFVFLAVVFLAGCTGLRRLPEGQHLFTGATIQYDSIKGLSNKREINSELYGLIKSTNTKFLWMRPFLSIHNMIREPKKDKGFRYFMKYKLGEKPVFLSDLNLSQINEAMENRLENKGHFYARSDYEVIKKKRTASVAFSIDAGNYYTISSVKYPLGSTELKEKIKRSGFQSVIKPGSYYSLDVIKQERSRIDRHLKNNGFFYFSPDYLFYDADSTLGNRQIGLELKLKPETPAISRKAYTLDKIFVMDDYSLENYYPDTTLIDNIYYISAKHNYKEKTILNAVFMRPDSIYSRQNHYNTLSQMMGLGIYKFANARFTISDTLNRKMDVGIYLTPQKKMSMGAEISGAVKTNNYIGPGLNLSFRNRNTFRGAELLTITLGGRFETQFSGEYEGETSYEVTLDGTLTFPRFVPIPFKRNLSRQFVPKTIVNTGGGLYSRVRYYELHSFNLRFGYQWRSSDRISNTFFPVDLSFTNLAKSSDEFEDYLNQNPTIRRSFEEQFILGSSYVFTYSNMHKTNRRTNFYISEGIDVSGNLASLLMSGIKGKPPGPDNQYQILNVPYSQFFRLRNEIRYFINLGKKDRLAWRIILAGGIPYGNSTTMPYVKQFFVGGTNSVRAFRARTVGPGTYYPPDTLSTVYVDQAGDIKFETTLEYRFPIYGYFKGAFFVDAGNIWLVNEDEQRPGGDFRASDFYKELAVGSGFGARIDFSFVVIRFDLAFPLRKPYLPEGERWVFDKIELGSSSWRKQNIILNIAIGYPF